MNAMPLKVVNGATIRLGDVAQVRDGYAVQTNIVRATARAGAAHRDAQWQGFHSGGGDNVKAALRKFWPG